MSVNVTEFSLDAQRILDSMLLYLIERITRMSVKAAVVNEHHQRQEHSVYIYASSTRAGLTFDLTERMAFIVGDLDVQGYSPYAHEYCFVVIKSKLSL